MGLFGEHLAKLIGGLDGKLCPHTVVQIFLENTSKVTSALGWPKTKLNKVQAFISNS